MKCGAIHPRPNLGTSPIAEVESCVLVTRKAERRKGRRQPLDFSPLQNSSLLAFPITSSRHAVQAGSPDRRAGRRMGAGHGIGVEKASAAEKRLCRRPAVDAALCPIVSPRHLQARGEPTCHDAVAAPARRRPRGGHDAGDEPRYPRAGRRFVRLAVGASKVDAVHTVDESRAWQSG